MQYKNVIMCWIARSEPCLFFTNDIIIFSKLCESFIYESRKKFTQATDKGYTSIVIRITFGTLVFIHQFVGIIPVLRIILKSFTIISLYSFGLNFINSFIMLSIPFDLLFFSLFIRLLISVVVKSLLRASSPFDEISFMSKFGLALFRSSLSIWKWLYREVMSIELFLICFLGFNRFQYSFGLVDFSFLNLSCRFLLKIWRFLFINFL